MTRETDQERMCRALFNEQKSTLTLAAEMLSYRGVAPEQTLRKALTDLEGRSFHEECGQGSALRAVLKVAIAYNYTLMDPQSAFASPVPANDGNLAAQILAALPRYERAVYFLSEILYCSRHDTALLLGISDSNVDQLVEFAKKRNRVYG